MCKKVKHSNKRGVWVELIFHLTQNLLCIIESKVVIMVKD